MVKSSLPSTAPLHNSSDFVDIDTAPSWSRLKQQQQQQQQQHSVAILAQVGTVCRGPGLGFLVSVGRARVHFVHRFLVGEECLIVLVQLNGAVIVRCAYFEGFWVLEIWSRLPRCLFRCLRRLPRPPVLRLLWPPPPVCFQLPFLLWEGGWPCCLGLRAVSLTLEPRQQLLRMWLSSLSTLLGVR